MRENYQKHPRMLRNFVTVFQIHSTHFRPAQGLGKLLHLRAWHCRFSSQFHTLYPIFRVVSDT